MEVKRACSGRVRGKGWDFYHVEIFRLFERAVLGEDVDGDGEL